MRESRHLRGSRARNLARLCVGVEIQEMQERQLAQISKAIQESATQLHQRFSAKRADADDERRSQRPGVGLHDRDAEIRDLDVLLVVVVSAASATARPASFRFVPLDALGGRLSSRRISSIVSDSDFGFWPRPSVAPSGRSSTIFAEERGFVQRLHEVHASRESRSAGSFDKRFQHNRPFDLGQRT